MSKQLSKSIRVPYAKSVHGEEEVRAVAKVLRGNTALGKKTEDFEKKIAKMFGKRFGVMVNSGSSANLLAFELLNLPKRAEVITPLLTFATAVSPIVQKGLVPVFVDVDLDTYIVNIDQVEKAITKRTKVLMIPSLLGNIPNLKRLAAIAQKHKLFLIEDSCDTLGASYAGKPTGQYSHITTTSFYGSHLINGAGGGGMICVNDPVWYKRLLVLRGWGRASSLFGEKEKSEKLSNRFKTKVGGRVYDAKFIFSELGYNFLPLEVSSAFALVQLRKFKGFFAARERNFKKLMNFFESYKKFFILPKQTPGSRTAWLAFPLLIKNSAPFSRYEIVTFLEKNNIQTRPVFGGNILAQLGFKKIKHRLARDSYPNTDLATQNAFLIGCHQGLSRQQLDYLKNKFSEFISKFK